MLERTTTISINFSALMKRLKQGKLKNKVGIFCCLLSEQEEHQAAKLKKPKTTTALPSPINIYKKENLTVFNSQILAIIKKHNSSNQASHLLLKKEPTLEHAKRPDKFCINKYCGVPATMYGNELVIISATSLKITPSSQVCCILDMIKSFFSPQHN